MSTHKICFYGEIKKKICGNPAYQELSFKNKVLFVLIFYGPVNPVGSCRARSVYLTTCLLGRLSPLSG